MESLERKIDLLRAIGPFAELPTARLKPVAQAAEVTRFGSGEVIVRQGDPGDAVYALTEGAAEVWLEDVPQRPVLLRTMRSGQLFGETAVLYRGPRSATIKAKTDVTTVRVPAPAFLELLQSSPELAVRIAVILAQRLASDRHTLTSDHTTAGDT
jgi:CRP-like cAMP-binding protein